MKKTNLNLMLTDYAELNPSEMYGVNGGKITLFKVIVFIGIVAFVMGVVNGCNSSRR